MKRLTEREAYVAMYAFLQHWHGLTQSDAIAALLGSMSLLQDDIPFDPALWDDWLDAIKAVESGTVDVYMTLKPFPPGES